MVHYNLQFAKFVSQFLLRKTSNNLDACLSLRPLSMANGACPARNYTDVQGKGHLVTYRKPKLILRWVSLTTFFFFKKCDMHYRFIVSTRYVHVKVIRNMSEMVNVVYKYMYVLWNVVYRFPFLKTLKHTSISLFLSLIKRKKGQKMTSNS